MLLNTLLGCLIFLITNLSLLYISHLLVRRFLDDAPASIRLVSTGLLFYALIILIFQILSPFHAISKTWVTISCLLPALLLHFTWGEKRNLQADLEPVRLWVRDGLSSKWALLLVIAGFVVFLAFSQALLTPPLGVDCLKYHLTFAALWIKKGTLLFLKAPDDFTMAMHYPINGEIIASWLLLPFHNDLLVNIMNFPITLLGGISCYAIARELGLTRKEASFVPALICFAPVVFAQITTQYVDSAVFAFCSVSVLFAFRYLRRGCLPDFLLSFISAGILLGTKYTAIPLVAIIVIASILKMISLANYSHFLRKVLWTVLGLLILCIFGGRQYIGNMIEAGNPLFPLPITFFDHEFVEGWPKLEQFSERMQLYDQEHGLDKFTLWEKEYRGFFYLSKTAGPKFFLFLILAFLSLCAKPRGIPRNSWYFLTVMWSVPIVLFYTNPSTEFNRIGFFAVGSMRFLIPSLALFTVQGLVVLKKYSKYLKKIEFFLAVLVVWDLLQVYKYHLWDIYEVAIIYPYLVLMIPVLLVLFQLAPSRLKRFHLKKEFFSISTGPFRLKMPIISRWVSYTLSFTSLVAGLFFLQIYRDSTRYIHYSSQSEASLFPEKLVDAWDYLDKPGEKRTIAMTTGWPGSWCFYPLLGRYLQNDITYISAKHEDKVPTWFDQGLLRGNNFLIWIKNLKKEKVDFILLADPWPIELGWIKEQPEHFQNVFNDTRCNIYKHTQHKKSDTVQ